jgi:hypothetical protein
LSTFQSGTSDFREGIAASFGWRIVGYLTHKRASSPDSHFHFDGGPSGGSDGYACAHARAALA